jgi:putative FmdB family regulatory protein
MPIYEYICQDCNERFETLVQGSKIPACPSCQSQKLEQQLSVFAVGRGNSFKAASTPAPCGSCGDPRGPGSCSLN